MEKNNLNLTGTEQGKTVAILAYLTIIGLVAALLMNNSKPTSLGRFHIRQSIGLTLTAIVLGTLNFIPGIGSIISPILGIIILIALILGILGAVNAKEKELPVVGSFYQKWFSMI